MQQSLAPSLQMRKLMTARNARQWRIRLLFSAA